MGDEKRPSNLAHSSDNPASRNNAGNEAALNGRQGGGDSGGGAYPNPHSGKESGGERDGFMGHGGQSGMGYYGHGQLADQNVEGGNANAPAGGHESQKKD